MSLSGECARLDLPERHKGSHQMYVAWQPYVTGPLVLRLCLRHAVDMQQNELWSLREEV
jgi:hypothetical protein